MRRLCDTELGERVTCVRLADWHARLQRNELAKLFKIKFAFFGIGNTDLRQRKGEQFIEI